MWALFKDKNEINEKTRKNANSRTKAKKRDIKTKLEKSKENSS